MTHPFTLPFDPKLNTSEPVYDVQEARKFISDQVLQIMRSWTSQEDGPGESSLAEWLSQGTEESEPLIIKGLSQEDRL